MTFLLYQADTSSGSRRLRPVGDPCVTYNLPRLLQGAWVHRKLRPNMGWDISADELIWLHSNGADSYETRRLLRDFDPSARWRIGITEVLHVYAYTWGGDDAPEWTPFMIRGRDLVSEYHGNLTASLKKDIIANLPERKEGGSEYVEFLYCDVNKVGNWVWGRAGATGAAFIQEEAREYFKTVF